MFTGIIEKLGKIKSISKNSVEISVILDDIKPGDSISINGVCLTVSKILSDSLCFDVSPETLDKTNIGKLIIGENVNIERAMKPSDRFGGHMVSGHVEDSGKIVSIKKSTEFSTFKISYPEKLGRYLVLKGSVAVDGISLTISELTDNTFDIAVIPHTIKNTNLQFKNINDTVNIETDLIAKYIEKIVSKPEKSKISKEFLLKHGF